MAAKSKSKSYLNNPALQFISSALVDEANEKEAPQAAAQPQQEAAKPVQAEQPAPAAQPPQTPVVPATPAADKPVYEVPMKPVYVEVRSKRFNALLQPSLYRNLSTLAASENISVNELMHRILASYVQEHM
ncbi:MAG: hypothetical protein Q4E65_08035 [Clostridia bacterium]|nr:hypothetical protein [Clostridia bacterium]